MIEDELFESEQEQEAAREAADIGGVAGDEALDPAERAVIEAGGGEAEGFELAEQELIEHASHTDQQSAHAILHHQGLPEEPGTTAEDEVAGDHEHSSESESED